MTDISEVRKLKLHPQAIYTFIQAQAGSLGKALSETVMNSLDAFCTKVDITLQADGYIIEDDGQGFTSRDEIDSWFETLGWPHDEIGANHRQFGRFGLGRGQQWSYASNVWHSNHFRMAVDVRQNGLDYDLTELPEAALLGTRIEGTFYRTLSFSELQTVERELRELVKYVSVPVWFNGQQISRDPKTETWDFETPEAYVKLEDTGSLAVYNVGILVNNFQRYKYKCGGVVVTKPDFPLSLNVARNEILEHDCKVWPVIKESLPEDKPKSAPKTEMVSEGRQKELIRAVRAGDMRLQAALREAPHLLINVHGRSVGTAELAGYTSRPVVFLPKGDEFGKRIMKGRLALVVADSVLGKWGCADPVEFRELVGKLIERDGVAHEVRYVAELPKQTWTVDAKSLFPKLAANRITLSSREMDEPSKAASVGLSSNARYLTEKLHKMFKNLGLPVKGWNYFGLELGDAADDIAWLSDTGSVVMRRKEALKALQGGMSSLVSHMLLCLRTALREIAGERTDTLLLDAFSGSEDLGNFALFAMARYVRECNQRSLPLPKRLVAELDQASVD